MRMFGKKLFRLPVLVAGLGLILVDPVTAQTFKNLFSFTNGQPYGGLVLSGNTLYGTASGGSWGRGMAFKVNTDGTGFVNLHSFSNGSDGSAPYAGLISGNTLYGMASSGGVAAGTVFKINTNGTGFTTVYNFRAGGYNSANVYTNSDGVHPQAGAILASNTLYGTAVDGGNSGFGTVFKLNTNGTGFRVLHSFTAIGPSSSTNSDGGWPYGSLVVSDNTLFGTANIGGSSGFGTVFAVNTDGTGFTNLHNFTYPDGTSPNAGLVLSGNNLYGATPYGGDGGVGSVFSIHKDGTGFTNIHSFNGIDGSRPLGGLVLLGNTLYGTESMGGSSGNGSVFAIHIDGTGFTNLHRFTAYSPPSYFTNSDGGNPLDGLILSGNTLYGATSGGGSSGMGTLFSLALPGPPQLTVIPSATHVILKWPTNATGFTLHSTTNLGSSTVWSTNSAAPVVVNGRYTVTNPISAKQQFFRLSQ
jgi:uncharacterized repeat protein (TIGR03803 family)